MLFQHPRYCASTEVAQLLYIPPGWSEMYSSGGPRRLMRTITIHLVLFECEFSFSEWVFCFVDQFYRCCCCYFVDAYISLTIIYFFFIELYSAHLIYAVAMFFDMPILYFTALSSCPTHTHLPSSPLVTPFALFFTP